MTVLQLPFAVLQCFVFIQVFVSPVKSLTKIIVIITLNAYQDAVTKINAVISFTVIKNARQIVIVQAPPTVVVKDIVPMKRFVKAPKVRTTIAMKMKNALLNTVLTINANNSLLTSLELLS